MITSINRDKYTLLLTENLLALRAKLHLTQADIAARTGMSRQTYMSIENQKQKMSWSNFMSLLCIFKENEDTKQLLEVLDIYSDELKNYLKAFC